MAQDSVARLLEVVSYFDSMVFVSREPQSLQTTAQFSLENKLLIIDDQTANRNRNSPYLIKICWASRRDLVCWGFGFTPHDVQSKDTTTLHVKQGYILSRKQTEITEQKGRRHRLTSKISTYYSKAMCA